MRKSIARVTWYGTTTTGIVVANGSIMTYGFRPEIGDLVSVSVEGNTATGYVTGNTLLPFALIDTGTRGLGLEMVSWGSEVTLRPGHRLHALGFPLDAAVDPSVSSATFLAVRVQGGVNAIETDEPLHGDLAGAPVFNDCGAVVGVSTGSMAAPGVTISETVARAIYNEMRTNHSMGGLDRPANPEPPRTGCAVGSSVTLVDPSVIGRTFRQGDAFEVTFDYVAPSCKSVAVVFSGYHAAGTPMYEFWCVAPAPDIPTIATCRGDRLVDVFAVSEQSALPAAEGRHTVVLDESAISPAPIDVPRLEGFTICLVRVELNEARFPGTVLNADFGVPC